MRELCDLCPWSRAPTAGRLGPDISSTGPRPEKDTAMNLYPADEAARIHRRERLSAARRHRQLVPVTEVRRTRRPLRRPADLP